MADAKDIFLQALSGASSSGANIDDLSMFQQDIAKNNLYGDIGGAIIGNKFDSSTWTPQQTGLATALQMFTGTLLKDLGERDQARQLSSMAQILPQLQTNPASVSLPEGVDPIAFGKYKLNAMTRNKISDSETKKLEAKAKLEILGDLLTKSPRLGADFLGLDLPTPEVRAKAGDIADIGPDLGVPTLSQIYNDTYQEALAQGEGSVQASIKARELTDSLRKQQKASLGESLKDMDKKISDLETLVSKAEEGISKAGNTGSKVASMYEKAVSTLVPWSTPEADRQAAGDMKLREVQAATVAATRFPGAMSDPDREFLLSAAIGADQPKASNENALKGYKVALENAKEYRRFMDYFVEKTGGNPSRAQTLWDLYKTENPLTVKNPATGDTLLNENRTRWEDFDFANAYKNRMSKGMGLTETVGTTAPISKKPRVISFRKIGG